MTSSPLSRTLLPARLCAADRAQVLHTAMQLCEGLQRIPLIPSESGLALLPWQDAVMHQPFYLGEVPMSRAAVALTNHLGQRIEGGAVLMADDLPLAEALAVLDAVWAHRWPGAEQVAALAAQGQQVLAHRRAARHTMLTRTRVDFSLLSQADEANEADPSDAAEDATP